MVEFELDIVQRELDQGNTVFFAYCPGGESVCEANNPRPEQKFRSSRCAPCVSRVSSGLDWLEKSRGEIRAIEFKFLQPFQEQRIRDVKAQILDCGDSFRKVKNQLSPEEGICWNAAFSSLITSLRDANPDLGRYRLRFSLLMQQAMESHASMENHLRDRNIDLVYVYNGRMARYWPALRAVEAAGVPRKLYEFAGANFSNYPVYESARIHDTEDSALELREKFYNLSHRERENFNALASGWFGQARRGRRTGIQRKQLDKSLKKTRVGALPNDWPASSQEPVVTFFLSSQYELTGSHSRADQAIPDQISIIRSCLDRFPEIIFCVRVHPKQPDSDRDFLRRLDELRRAENCLLVEKSAPVDSVSIGLASRLAVTFGSTVGAQLAWEGKRVLEFGVPSFSIFGATENVREFDDLASRIEAAIEVRNEDGGSSVAQKGAEMAVAARLAFGQRPVYLRKTSFRGAEMVRGNAVKRIRPNFFWVLVELVDTFFSNPIDFFGRVRRRIYWSTR